MQGPPAACPNEGGCFVEVCVSEGPHAFLCERELRPTGTPCSDGDPCTAGEACDAAGHCAGGDVVRSCCRMAADCDDGDQCTLDLCSAGSCLNTSLAGAPCDDRDPCTAGDICSRGSCAGAPVQCEDGAQCVDGLCQGGTGSPEGAAVHLSAANFNGHACVVLEGGRVACWGRNDHGQLGDGTKTSRSAPVLVGGPPVAIQVETGHLHTCALIESGRVACWGDGQFGQLGNRKFSSSATPVMVAGINNAVDLAAGQWGNCAVLADGTVRCWGKAENGALGNGIFFPDRARAVEVFDLTSAVSVDAGLTFACAVLRDGTLRCWGSGTECQLGWTEVLCGNQFTPARVAVGINILGNARQVTCGELHTCAVQNDGDLWCWGENSSGQLGLGHTNRARTGREVPGVEDAVHACAGKDFSCVVHETGRVSCFGNNESGQLGNGTRRSSTSPVRVEGITDAVEVTCGASFACARHSTGDVSCWGRNNHGSLGTGSSASSSTPLPVAIQ